MRLLAVAFLIFGESLSILAEILASKNATPFLGWRNSLPLITLGGMFLLAGYVVGYQAFKNIWPVVALSIGSILVIEPALVWLLLHEMPNRGSAIGLGLGVLGLLSTLFL